jgi:ferric-dicitrate binding protein FerR (iron transport regulator)
VKAEELIRRFLDDLATDEERAELDRALAASPEAADAFARASRREQALRALLGEARAIADVTARIRRAARPRRVWPWAASAAAAALIALASVLIPGPAPVATLTEAGPEVAVLRGGTRLAAGPGFGLRGDDVVASGGGRASIVFEGEGTRLGLRPGTSLRLVSGGPGKLVFLSAGTVDADVERQVPGARFRLHTPHAEVRVIGTKFTVAATAVETRVEVGEGRVEFTRTADSARAEVASGQVAEARKTAAGRLSARPLRNAHEERFLSLWRDLHDPASGYFSPEGVPYHAAETLIVDAPDYGHLTTSETFSYWLWLEAAYGRLTGDWSWLNRAWAKMEEVLIPSAADQPTIGAYDPKRPASVAPERPQPEQYPVTLDVRAPVGPDSLAEELRSAYGTPLIYAMHWLADPDDWYGFGRRADRRRAAPLLNTFQRGPQESVWETVPHPAWEDFRTGGPRGFLDLFIREDRYGRQWRYTCAPDADARAVQAIYWAARWAEEQGRDPAATLPLAQAVRLGDSLRYALREKYFRSEPHLLLSWSYAWGGSLDASPPWSWRSGSGHVHFGYQNPLAAWVLSASPRFRSAAPGGPREWASSLERQVEFYRWLQSADGAIAGGAAPGGADFYGLGYDEHPVFRDPPSNAWFGWQAWSMERLAQYASASGDARARAVVDRWASWVRRVVRLTPDGGYLIPATLRWSGRPDPWNPERPGPNAGLRVEVADETTDVGVAAGVARALLYHGGSESRALAGEILDRMWGRFRDERGVSAPEARPDYARFRERVPLPEGWTATLPGGEKVGAGATFLDLRPNYRHDPGFPSLERSLRTGDPPVFRYHRFWAQVEVALANAEFARLSR